MNELPELRDLPADGWPAWLVHADALTEAGDERGELLVLDYQGQPVRDRALAWVESWRAYLPYYDVLAFEALCDMPRLAPRAPADLAAPYAQPISQLLALLELGNEQSWDEVSAPFERQHARIAAATLAWIDRAFDGVPPPDEAHRTIHQAEAADNHDMCDRSRDHFGRWQDLPEAHLLANQWAVPHLDVQGMHYYIPAVMTFALRYAGTGHLEDRWITESLGYTLGRAKPNLRDYQRARFAAFDHGQRAAILAYVLTAGVSDAIGPWMRVLDYEREGPRADWYDHFI